jgi:hypothetical protein
MAYLSAFVFLVLSAPLFAAPGPTPVIPFPGEDSVLTGGLPARQFFEDRATKNPVCTANLITAKKKVRDLLKLVADLKDSRAGKTPEEIEAINDKIDAYENEKTPVDVNLLVARTKMLDLMQECGECATRKLDLVESDILLPDGRKDPSKTQKWYVSNGSCQLPTKDPKILANVFEVLSKSLIRADDYPKSAPGGFANIVNFKQARSSDLHVLPDNEFPDATKDKSMNIYLWVLGPKIGAQFIFYYYLTSFHDTYKTARGVDEFFMNFQTQPDARLKGSWKAPGGPAIFDTTLSGRRANSFITELPLANVKGQWYVNGDGYLRYYTAAEFPLKIKEIETLGRRILIRTITDAAARGKWETLP